jgi:hypothetical protein
MNIHQLLNDVSAMVTTTTGIITLSHLYGTQKKGA